MRTNETTEQQVPESTAAKVSPSQNNSKPRRTKKQPQKNVVYIENPSLPGRILDGILRRIYLGIRILFKVALIVPIPLFMIYVSYTVDRSGLFQGALTPRRIVDLMLKGYDVTNFEQMDERAVVELYAQLVPEAPQGIGIGSSRVLQFNRKNTGIDRWFNMGVTGADVRDNMTSYYKMVSYDKAPEVLIWSVDPWVFYNSENAYDSRADADLYNEFLENVLGIETDYEEPDQVELWKALVDPAYFQGNVDYYKKNNGQDVVTDDEGNVIDFNPVEDDPYNQVYTVKCSDGSVLYDINFRNRSQDEVLYDAAVASTTFNSVHMEGFDAMSSVQQDAFDAFLRYARSQGTTVILVLSPWHNYLYERLIEDKDQHKGFFQVEPWLRQYCAQNNVPLYGSYDPQCIEGLVDEDFFDGLHCKGSGIEKFFPGVPAVLEAVQNGTLPNPLAVTPRTDSVVPTA